ncbi:MAG: NAD(P)H-quinone oxidoreductase subunit I, partial [Cyanobacteria bacterium J06638_6]
LPYKVTQDPMVTPLRELAYLPKGVMDPHDLPANARRAGQLPQEILAAETEATAPSKGED